jgi:hypothetical protein
MVGGSPTATYRRGALRRVCGAVRHSSSIIGGLYLRAGVIREARLGKKRSPRGEGSWTLADGDPRQCAGEPVRGISSKRDRRRGRHAAGQDTAKLIERGHHDIPGSVSCKINSASSSACLNPSAVGARKRPGGSCNLLPGLSGRQSCTERSSRVAGGVLCPTSPFWGMATAADRSVPPG